MDFLTKSKLSQVLDLTEQTIALHTSLRILTSEVFQNCQTIRKKKTQYSDHPLRLSIILSRGKSQHDCPCFPRCRPAAKPATLQPARRVPGSHTAKSLLFASSTPVPPLKSGALATPSTLLLRVRNNWFFESISEGSSHIIQVSQNWPPNIWGWVILCGMGVLPCLVRC